MIFLAVGLCVEDWRRQDLGFMAKEPEIVETLVATPQWHKRQADTTEKRQIPSSREHPNTNVQNRSRAPETF
jgi:hypothetical protein